MRSTLNLLALALTCCALGCVSADKIVNDTTPRPPTTAVDIYKDGKLPEKKFKQIAEVTFLGPRQEELRAQKRFTKQAMELGGNGVIFTVVPAGQKGGGAFGAAGGGWSTSTTWLFKGQVVVYE